MNDNFDFPKAPKEEITMTQEEIKTHKKVFSHLGFACLSYLLVLDILSFFVGNLIKDLAPQLLSNRDFVFILSLSFQYLVAFPVLLLCVRSLPKSKPTKTPTKIKTGLKYLVVCMFFIYVGSYISTFLTTKIGSLVGKVPENTINTLLDSTSIWVNILIVGIIGPIFEELIFRKTLIDRLSSYSAVISILLPSLIFALFHGNLYQFFYAFFIGALLSYVYLKTGNILHTMLLHVFINLFCGVLPTFIYSILDYNQLIDLVSNGALTEEYIMANLLPLILFLVYSYGMYVMVGIGVFVFFRNIRKLNLSKGKIQFPKGVASDVIFFNIGIIALIGYCVWIIANNTFG